MLGQLQTEMGYVEAICIMIQMSIRQTSIWTHPSFFLNGIVILKPYACVCVPCLCHFVVLVCICVCMAAGTRGADST